MVGYILDAVVSVLTPICSLVHHITNYVRTLASIFIDGFVNCALSYASYAGCDIYICTYDTLYTYYLLYDVIMRSMCTIVL